MCIVSPAIEKKKGQWIDCVCVRVFAGMCENGHIRMWICTGPNCYALKKKGLIKRVKDSESVGASFNPPLLRTWAQLSWRQSQDQINSKALRGLPQLHLLRLSCTHASTHIPSSRVQISGRSAGLSLMYVRPVTLMLTLYRAISISLHKRRKETVRNLSKHHYI